MVSCLQGSLHQLDEEHPQIGARTQPGNPQPGIPTTRKDTTRKITTRKRHNLEETQPGRDVTRKGFNP